VLTIRWFDHVTNANVISQPGQEDLASNISRRLMWRSLDMFIDYRGRQ